MTYSPLVRGAAVWALSRLLPRDKLADCAMAKAMRGRDEWTAALA